jgi:hypothetical protein
MNDVPTVTPTTPDEARRRLLVRLKKIDDLLDSAAKQITAFDLGVMLRQATAEVAACLRELVDLLAP